MKNPAARLFLPGLIAGVLLLLLPLHSQATHVAGADIQYASTGPRQWKITLTVYRFCEGASLCSNMSCTRNITISPSPQLSAGGLNPNGCNGPQINLSLNLVKVEDVGKENIARCGPSAKNGCDNLGQVTPGPYRPSIERHIFEGILDMSAPAYDAVCPYYDIYFSECCRNSTTNVNGQPNFSVKATLNIRDRSGSTPRNNSPVFTRDAISIFCAGQQHIYNLGAYDPDGDSLTYEIARSLHGLNTPVLYNAPYNEYIPFPLNQTLPPHNQYSWPARVVLDTLTGDISLNPRNNGLTPIAGDLSVRITQWSYSVNAQTGVKTPFVAGITMRNLQIYSVPCTANNPPALSTSPSLPNGKPKLHWDVCPGEQICFTVTAKDTDHYPMQVSPRIDTTYLSWNQALVRPGKVSFLPDYDTTQARPREDRYRFCWQTDTSDERSLPYYFTITGMDNICPNPGKVTQAFSIRVGGIRVLADLLTGNLNCGRRLLQVRKTNGLQVLSAASLEVAKEPWDFTFAGGSVVIHSANPNPAGSGNAPRTVISETIYFDKPGKYLVKYILSSDCATTYYDTISIGNEQVTSNLPDTLKCKGTPLSITVSPSGGTGPYTYQWYKNNPLSPAVGNAAQYISNDNSSTRYFIQVRDSLNCLTWDTLQVNVKTIASSGLIGVNDSSQCITVNSFVFHHKPVPGFSDYTHRWLAENQASTDSLLTVSYGSSGSKTVRLIISETNGCTDTTTRTVQVTPVPSAGGRIRVNDSIQCISINRFIYSYNRQPGVRYMWEENNVLLSDSMLTRTYAQPGSYQIRLIAGDSACADTAIGHVRVTGLAVSPPAILVNDSVQCISGNLFRFSYQRSPAQTYYWLYEQMKTDSVLTMTYASTGLKQMKLVTGLEGCFDTIATNVRVTSAPVVNNIISVNQLTQCVGTNFFTFTHNGVNDSSRFRFTWISPDTLSHTYAFNTRFTTPGLKRVKLLVWEPGACYDTAFSQVSVTAVPVARSGIVINDSIQCVTNNLFRLSYNKSAGPAYKWLYNGTFYTDSVLLVTTNTTGESSVKLIVGTPGCSDTASQLLITTAKPVADNDIIADQLASCLKGNRFRFSYARKPLTEYKWVYDNATSGDSVLLLNYTEVGTKTVKLMLGDPGCSDTAVKQVQVWPQPATGNSSSSNDSIQCVNNNEFILTYNTTANPQHFFHQWIWENGSSGANPLKLHYTSPGIKHVKLILVTANACTDTVSIPLTVKPLPPPAAIQGPVTSIRVNDEFLYSVAPRPGETYQWLVWNGVLINGDTTPTVKVRWTSPGTGRLTVRNTFDGCTNEDSLLLSIGNTGIAENTGFPGWSIRPNPSSGTFVLTVPATTRKNIRIRICNTLGEEVLARHQPIGPGENHIEIHTDAAPGIYMVFLEGESETVSRKISISR